MRGDTEGTSYPGPVLGGPEADKHMIIENLRTPTARGPRRFSVSPYKIPVKSPSYKGNVVPGPSGLVETDNASYLIHCLL